MSDRIQLSLNELLAEMREADSLCARYADAIEAALAAPVPPATIPVGMDRDGNVVSVPNPLAASGADGALADEASVLNDELQRYLEEQGVTRKRLRGPFENAAIEEADRRWPPHAEAHNARVYDFRDGAMWAAARLRTAPMEQRCALCGQTHFIVLPADAACAKSTAPTREPGSLRKCKHGFTFAHTKGVTTPCPGPSAPSEAKP